MTKQNKPSFLKTFSEFTVDELRTMPVQRVLSLFLQEVKTTFTEEPTPRSAKKSTRKKKAVQPIITAQIKPAAGFTQAVKRVFAIHTSVTTSIGRQRSKPTKKITKVTRSTKERMTPKQEETVVFSSQQKPEENQMNTMI